MIGLPKQCKFSLCGNLRFLMPFKSVLVKYAGHSAHEVLIGKYEFLVNIISNERIPSILKIDAFVVNSRSKMKSK